MKAAKASWRRVGKVKNISRIASSNYNTRPTIEWCNKNARGHNATKKNIVSRIGHRHDTRIGVSSSSLVLMLESEEQVARWRSWIAERRPTWLGATMQPSQQCAGLTSRPRPVRGIPRAHAPWTPGDLSPRKWTFHCFIAQALRASACK